METIKTEEIVSMYNDENMSLAKIAETLKTSKSTISKTLKKGGYVLNKATKKYEVNVSRETIEIEGQQKLNINETNVSRETMVNRTYSISEKIDRAIKIKSAVEDKKPIDIVREALESYIEQKYLDFK